MAAMTHKGKVLEFAAQELQRDKEFVFSVCCENPSLLRTQNFETEAETEDAIQSGGHSVYFRKAKLAPRSPTWSQDPQHGAM